MPDFSPVITQAYMRILGRPADVAGLESYNRAMNAGLTEAQMRESLLRSPEYANNHPEASLRKSAPPKKRNKVSKRTRKR